MERVGRRSPGLVAVRRDAAAVRALDPAPGAVAALDPYAVPVTAPGRPGGPYDVAGRLEGDRVLLSGRAVTVLVGALAPG